MSNAPLLETRGVTRYFGALPAVEDVTFEIRRGEIAGLIGPNGAGKTTLFNLLTGTIPPTAGAIYFNGQDLVGLKSHQVASLGMQRTFQQTRPLQTETVLGNVVSGSHLKTHGGWWNALFGGRRARHEEAEQYARAGELLSKVGLQQSAGALPRELAAGQLRLLEIARCLAAGPELLLLDEPAAGLDQPETAVLEQLLREVRGIGTTLLIVEHDVELVFRMSDRVLVLNFGRQVFSGTPDEARKNKDVIEAYLGTQEEDGVDSNA